jgi:hypothetical protein
MLDRELVFEDLSQEHHDYQFELGYEMLCWIEKYVNFDGENIWFNFFAQVDKEVILIFC